MSDPIKIFIGLGSNEGDREQLIEEAIKQLSDALGMPLQKSSIIESEPWGFISSKPFLNMVISFATTISPLSLLDITEKIERNLGRTTKSTPTSSYKDRTIDIDILFYGKEIINSERLTIPHPHLHKRQFVLTPLTEIAPNFIHPLLEKSIKELNCNLKEGITTNCKIQTKTSE